MWNPFNSTHTATKPQTSTDCNLTYTPEGMLVTGLADAPKVLLNTPTHLPTALWTLRDVLTEQELATLDEIGLHIPYTSLANLKEGFAVLPLEDDTETTLLDPNVSELLPAFTPATLEISHSGPLSGKQLILSIKFWQDGIQQYPDRVGPILTDFGQTWLLTETQWQLCEQVTAFNRQPEKGQEANYATLARLYETIGINTGLQSDQVKLDASLGDVTILAPSQMTVGWENEGALVSAYPVFLNLPDGAEQTIKEAYFQQDGSQPILSFQSPDGKQTRLLMTQDMRNMTTRLRQTMRGLKPKDARMLGMPRNLANALADVAPVDMLALDDATYGPRVVGLGPLVFKPVVKVKTHDSVCLLPDNWLDLKRQFDDPHTSIVLEAVDGQGNPISIDVGKARLESVQAQIHQALKDGQGAVEITGEDGQTHIMPVSPDLALQVDKAVQGSKMPVEKTTTKEPAEDSHTGHLQLSSNEDQLNYDVSRQVENADSDDWANRLYKAPSNLVAQLNGQAFELSAYQKAGVAWLQQGFLDGKRGVLLADDMGLGKTLQVLTFLAWMLETGWSQWHQPQLSTDNLWHPQAANQQGIHPHPILVVVPKMLMENWRDEIHKFFKMQGEIFRNFEILDSKRAKEFMLDRSQKGNDFNNGSASLNLTTLKSYRLLVVNYDTAKNYYHSLAKIRWSCVVMDESQEIKNPKTAVNHAMSCIADNSRFRITMTGTPIENDLLDLWALMDVVVPGVLSSQQAFKKHFFNADLYSPSGWDIEGIKTRLGLPASLNPDEPASPAEPYRSAYVLGRSKAQFLGNELPTLIQQPAETCHYAYTSSEWQHQQDLIVDVLQARKKAAQLEVIQRIKLFSEHPILAMPKERRPKDDITVKYLLENSTKFSWLKQTLDSIKPTGEKVLVFTRSIQMQQWINQLLDTTYHKSFPPINGGISDRKQNGKSLTYTILQDFKEYPGFAVLVLSPEVAGVGLNITSANHVIHYGRWWNPAKEDQATCRAYRKGQKKPVYLYIPVGIAPEDTLSFDQRLDEVLRRKTAQRKNFLYPSAVIDDGELSELIPGLNLVTTQQEGHQFETIVAEWMLKKGFEQVKQTPGSSDYGVDVLAVKGNEWYLVQCKRTLKADPLIIQELKRGQAHYGSRYPGKMAVLVVAGQQPIPEAVRTFYKQQGLDVWGI